MSSMTIVEHRQGGFHKGKQRGVFFFFFEQRKGEYIDFKRCENEEE